MEASGEKPYEIKKKKNHTGKCVAETHVYTQTCITALSSGQDGGLCVFLSTVVFMVILHGVTIIIIHIVCIEIIKYCYVEFYRIYSVIDS